MESLSLEKRNIIKDIRKLFRLKKKKKTSQLKIEYLEILRTFLSMTKKNYYKPVRVSNLWRKTYIEYESKVIKIKHIS